MIPVLQLPPTEDAPQTKFALQTTFALTNQHAPQEPSTTSPLLLVESNVENSTMVAEVSWKSFVMSTPPTLTEQDTLVIKVFALKETTLAAQEPH